MKKTKRTLLKRSRVTVADNTEDCVMKRKNCLVPGVSGIAALTHSPIVTTALKRACFTCE